MDETKKRWQKPELTVLVRSNPEEAVLIVCKSADQGRDPQGNRCTIDIGTGPKNCEILSIT